MSNVLTERVPRSSQERRSEADRRVQERRRMNLVVLVERRSAEARRGDRRRGAEILALPRHRGNHAIQALVRQATQRVEASWSNATGAAASAGEVTELLRAIEHALTQWEQPDERLRSELGRALLGLVRSEVVRLANRADEMLRSGGLWHLMETIEQLQAKLDPDWQEHFASRLAGPDGLELVVEVAHDLRSPLTSVLFLSEVLAHGQSGPVNALQRRQLGLIYSAALGLTELAGNVIELTREGHRLSEEETAAFSITDVMMSVGDIVRPMAEEKGIEIRILPPTSDQRVGHTVALSRVLLNLTTNALKFTREGFVEIGARETTMSRVEFWVRDTGPGINEQSTQSLYAAFRRSPTGQGYQLSGTGLGLSICRKLVQVMGGVLELETRENWGTRFFFNLELPRPLGLE